MLKWKKPLAVGTALALAASLTACNSGGDKPAAEPKKEAGKEPVTITFSRGKDVTAATTKLIEAFEAKYPNIKVKMREMPADTGQSHDQYVTALTAGATDFDVIDVDVIWPAEFAQAGYVLPLDKFIERDKINMDDYIKGAVEAGNFNGKQWAMPRFIDTGLLYYRKDIVPESEVPKTWDELIAKAKAGKGKNGTQFGYLMQAKQYEGLVCNAIEFIAAYGGKVVDEKGNIVINSPETIKGLKKMVEVVQSDLVPKNITTFTELESHTSFIEGQSVFIRNWPYQWALAQDEKQSKIKDKVGVAPLPKGDVRSAATLGGWMTVINKNSKHPEEAWEFLKFITGPEGQKITAIHGGNPPTLKSVYKDADVLKAYPLLGDKGFADGLAQAVPRPVSPIYPKLSEIMQIEISKAISGQQTVEQAVKNMDEKMKAEQAKAAK